MPRIEGNDYFALCEKHGKDNIIPLPCGKCPSCIEARSKSWAIRCVCEGIYHKQSCFITLTYNPDSCPEFLVRSDMQKFLKRLRKKVDFRYFGCGEYGPHGAHRPHWHIILFGYFPSDAKLVTFIDGNPYFRSKELQALWKFGFVSITEATYASCAYVARYCQKKLGNPDHREITLMSLKPGIGMRYFEDNKDKIYKYDAIFGNFGRSLRHKPSKYFDKLLERFDPVGFQRLKQVRISKANSQVISDVLDHGFKYYEDLCRYNAEIKKDKMSKLRRKDL